MNYFIENNLFSKSQYGFIKGRSAVIQLIKIIDEWTDALDKGYQTDILYTDFEKAFDKVPHRRLISKLKFYGIQDKLVRWIEAFLTNRTQKVKINGVHSSIKPVLSGIPQRSVLVPILFAIYINDLPDVCKDLCNMYLFADDAKMYKTIKSDVDATTLNDCYQNMMSWSNKWCMKLNIDK